MPPKFFRLLLIGFGAIVAISGLVNLAAAIWLLEPSDADALGINLTLVKCTCAGVSLCGLALVYMGWRKKK